MVQRFVFVFGYESPHEAAATQRVGTDMESAGVLPVLAESKEAALEWGREVAEWYLGKLMRVDGYSWKARRYASWIEERPDRLLLETAEKVGDIARGSYPDFEQTKTAFGD